MNRLKAVMVLLVANDAPLPAERRDHPLEGVWSDCRECHVGGDFLLIYRIVDAARGQQVQFVRTGTHSELFG